MAFVNKSARSAAKSERGRFLTMALGAALFCSVTAGSIWGLASTLGAMHEARRALTDGPTLLAAARPARIAEVPADGERRVKISKFSSLSKPADSTLRARQQLTVAAIRMAHERRVAIQMAAVEAKQKAEKAKLMAAVALARTSLEQEEKITGKPPMVTALVEDVPVPEAQPFGLVLAKPDGEEQASLPSQIPLPETRPLIDPVAKAQKPEDVAPSRAKERGDKGLASAKPERSFFSNLFKSKSNEGGWPGKNTRVAIYDVSNATVYLPDGTKLRAHSGIGGMRDNPRFEHVSMRGPTPQGIYRLSMREQRFYGVEAIRMTSIDGRNPKNRTGLLTHTNLLRGQIGSHGCVAFQNYQPFLNAFKRGQVNMMVVVPELPSSQTQLAALYRKAGA